MQLRSVALNATAMDQRCNCFHFCAEELRISRICADLFTETFSGLCLNIDVLKVSRRIDAHAEMDPMCAKMSNHFVHVSTRLKEGCSDNRPWQTYVNLSNTCCDFPRQIFTSTMQIQSSSCTPGLDRREQTTKGSRSSLDSTSRTSPVIIPLLTPG